MDGLKKIVAVLALTTIMLAFAAPALARTQGMPMEQSNKDMMAALMDSKDISIPASTMKAAGLGGMMMPGEKYTLFVASDQALKAMSPDMKNMMVEKVKNRQTGIDFVKAHLVKGMVTPDGMTEGKALRLMNGKTMKVRTADGKMMVNDATIIKSVKANNGMIYVMDRIPSSIMAAMKDIGMMPASAIPAKK